MVNYISISRIVLAFSMAFVKPLSITFFAIYILSGSSDVLDGYIARKTNTTSKYLHFHYHLFLVNQM